MAGSRRQVSESEAAELVEAWRGSRQSLPAWCAARGLDGRAMRGWINRFARCPPVIRMVDVTPAAALAVAAPTVLELRFAGVTILVAPVRAGLAGIGWPAWSTSSGRPRPRGTCLCSSAGRARAGHGGWDPVWRTSASESAARVTVAFLPDLSRIQIRRSLLGRVLSRRRSRASMPT